MRTKIQDQFIKYLDQVSERKFVLYWMTKILNYPSVNETFNESTLVMNLTQDRFQPILTGEIFQQIVNDEKKLYVVSSSDDKSVTLELLGINLVTPLISINDNIIIYPGEIKNYKGSDNGRGSSALVTSPGMLLLNQRILVESFGDLVPYWEDEITVGRLDDLLAKLMMEEKITCDQGHKYLSNCYDIGYFAELNNRSFTDKTFTTSAEVLKRKKELFAAMTEADKHDPIKLAAIENELLKLDRAWLKGDEADVFHSAVGSKSYDIHRKKVLIGIGAIPTFSDKGEASFNFVENSLEDGWDKRAFDVLTNEIYKASYDRGAETAKGGELTKYVLRVYQDLGIDGVDCGTTLGSSVELISDPTAKVNLQFLGRNTLEDNTPITIEFLKQNAGKVIRIRDPLYCKSPSGICYKCMGQTFEQIEETNIGSYILDVSSGIMMISMKNMHGTKLSTFKINYADHFITI